MLNFSLKVLISALSIRNGVVYKISKARIYHRRIEYTVLNDMGLFMIYLLFKILISETINSENVVFNRFKLDIKYSQRKLVLWKI